ncbi:hypothetical protein NE237_027112 [Protea cynaroides]|uniref:Uncharacterized protein n=1 Tax=Protea cynaroides TaxID=273540 RepID=A0A9Q0GMS3_9MAGN|nr:hypothetical protein NE237_027112 [Protea cynaroides]
MATRTSSSPLPKSGASLKGYNFASTWEQVWENHPFFFFFFHLQLHNFISQISLTLDFLDYDVEFLINKGKHWETVDLSKCSLFETILRISSNHVTFSHNTWI